ncbi:heterokaryon incompatibility protein-domain-containing protein [Poronia punctata]|nr:heterokaryon incompatibility protein-domain-containing protein [Poronia punctata]
MPGKKSLSDRFSKLLHRGSRQYHNEGESTSTRLCDICKSIGFDDTEKSGEKETVFTLGMLDAIKQRTTSCAFCRLVLDAMQDERIIHMQSIDHYDTHLVRVFKQDRNRFAIQPLPSYSRVLFERDIKGPTDARVDYEMIRAWLASCETEHEECKANKGAFSGVDLSFFRCIDVVDMCIAPVSIEERYVALSYRWGDCVPFLLLNSNREDLFANGGLVTNWDLIPKTIQDSIEFVRGVGCRYVWIDQLCLIQDDDGDRGTGINAMDLVYEQAHFTIVAASGMDADSGLPGVREGSRSEIRQVKTEVMPGVNLVLRHTMQDMLIKSEYHHRGWTFQEYYLSRRKIIFLDGIIYFKCHQKVYQELEDGLPIKPDQTTIRGQALHKPSGDVYHLLGQLLNQYTTRNLKEPTDYVPAMAGICRRLADYAQCGLLYGIPVAALDWFLLFYSNKEGLKRRDCFPTWAWSGWYGSIYYNFGSGDVMKWTDNSTWIAWYKRDPGGVLTRVWDHQGSRANELFGELLDVSHTEASKELDIPRQYRYTVLQFWTAAANFSLRKIEQQEGEVMMWPYGLYWTPTTYELVDMNGSNCGFVTLDDPSQTGRDGSNAEFILLSLSAEKSRGTSGRNDAAEAGGRFFWVLMIEWDQGVAERRGIGKLKREGLTACLESTVSWKEIVLG